MLSKKALIGSTLAIALLILGATVTATSPDPTAPTTSSLQATKGGDTDAFVAKNSYIPEVISLAPPANTHTAPLTASVSITYSQAISVTTVNTRTFAVHAMQTGLLTRTYSVDGGTISLTPIQPFKLGELVQTSATTGTLSLSGQEPISPTVWQFRAAVAGGSGIFDDSGQSLSSSESAAVVALGDLDGDGDLDAFFGNWGQANTVWLNDGAGHFTDSGQRLDSSYSSAVVLGDVDGDGNLDAFVANYWNQPNKVWLNNGAGTFSDSGQSLGSSDSHGVAMGDLDGDGDLDAFVGNAHDQANKVWLNDGAGHFIDSGQSLGSSNSLDVALGDVDGDGDLDAFVTSYDIGNYDQSITVWLNDGTGTFTDSGQSLGSSYQAAVALGDVDGDGDLDAFVGNVGTSSVLLNDGAGNFSDSGQSLDNPDHCVVALGDVDGDGDLDAFVGNWSSNADKIWLNNGAGTFSDSGQRLGSSASSAVVLGDVDGDGDLDAFVGSNSGQANKVWLNRNRADLSLDKLVTPAVAAPGQCITYTLTYTNNGPQLANGVLITDVVPITLTNVNYTYSGAQITPTGSVSYTWQVGNLAAGAGGVITITGRISTEVVLGTLISNTASIAATSVDNDTADNTALVMITVRAPYFVATKTASPAGAVRPGDLLTYTITFTNTGNADATTAALTDPIPAHTTYVSGSAAANSGTLTDTAGIQWSGVVTAGQAVSITFQVTVTSPLTDDTRITNTATISDSVILSPVLVTATTTVDSLPPSGSITIDGDATYATSTAVNLILSASDATSGVSQMCFSNDGITYSGWQGYAISASWALSTGDGTKTVYVRYKDNAGNISAPFSDTIVLDTAAPSGSVSINDGASYTNTTLVTLTLSADDAFSGVAQMSFSNDETNWSDWEVHRTGRSWTLTPGDGTKTVYVRYKDNAGNIATYSDTIILDATPPSSTVEALAAYQANTSFMVFWSGSDALAGLASYDVQFKDGTGVSWEDWQVGTIATSTAFVGEEGHTYYLQSRARDNAGNVEAYPGGDGDTHTTVDVTSPSGSVLVNNGAVDTTSTDVILKPSASDSVSGVSQMSFSNDGSSWSNWEDYSTSKSWSLTGGDGLKTAYVRYRDNAGNISSVYTDTINLDTTVQPEYGLSINEGALFTNKITVTLTLPANPHTAQMMVSNDGGFAGAQWEPYATHKEWQITQYGAYVIPRIVYAKYKDTEGVISGVYQDDIILDVTAPNSSITNLSRIGVSPSARVSTLSNSTVPVAVEWEGSDDVSGVKWYDIQYKQGSAGAWTDWLTRTTQTSATFNATPGHTYYFQSRAEDHAGNWEDYPGGDGDAHICIPTFTYGVYLPLLQKSR